MLLNKEQIWPKLSRISEMYKQKVFVRKITIFADSEMVTIFWLVLAAKCYFEE